MVCWWVMPVLPNQRHERFAQELAKGKTADDAYELAGYKRNRRNATTLKSKQDIQSRLAELLQSAWDRSELTKDWVIEKLKVVHSAAIEQKQLGSANRALELMGKELGMFVDRTQQDVSLSDEREAKPDFAETLAKSTGSTATSSPDSGNDKPKSRLTH